MVIILYEGRMMRETGLDKPGNPKTVPGVQPIFLNCRPMEKWWLYSGGSHHVPVSGQPVSKFFKRKRISCEKNVRDHVKQKKEVSGITFIKGTGQRPTNTIGTK